MDIKILHCPDLHIYDKEIGHSVGYPEESLYILDQIKDEFKVGEYDIISLGGDIQHAKITKTRYISAFQKKIKELGRLAYDRLKERDLLKDLRVYDLKNNLVDIENKKSVLFSNRGQHDTSSTEEFTFFDLLIENNIMVNPSKVFIRDLQINYLNYTKNIKELTTTRKDTTRKMINIYHNPIVERGYFVDEIIGKTITPENHNLFKDVDLAIINDIHIPLGAREVVANGQKTTIITPGSLGRTSFSKSHDRDYGNIVVIEIDSEYKMNTYMVEIELTPAEEFFNKIEVFKQKRVENAFKNFSIEIEDIEMTYFDVKQKIEELVEDDEIKDICYYILED